MRRQFNSAFPTPFRIVWPWRWALPICAALVACLAVMTSAATAQQPEGQPQEPEVQQQSAGESNQQPTNQPRGEDQSAPGTEQQGATPQAGDETAELGVIVSPSPGEGVLVRGTQPRGAAAAAGIRTGDFILSLNGQDVSSPEQLRELIDRLAPDQQAEIVIWRNGERQTLHATLARRRTAGYRGEQQQMEPESRAWLGVAIDQQGDDNRVRIAAVSPIGPAALSGLQAGDVIERVDGQEVTSPDDITKIMEQLNPGDEVELTILRNGQRETIEARLRRRPAFLSNLERFAEDPGGIGEQLMVPERAMMVEHNRHIARQHERIETLLHDLVEEVRALRQEVERMGGGAETERDTEATERVEP